MDQRSEYQGIIGMLGAVCNDLKNPMTTQYLPDFLIVGAAKAGTTALHTYFQQHPNIEMTPSKETNFFAYEGKALDFKGPGDDGINTFSITTLTRYQAEFKDCDPRAVRGEACPLYLYDSSAADRIERYLPQVKIIVILRNPIQRAFANYLHLIRDDREPLTDFGLAIQAEDERVKANWEWFWHYSKIGFYGEQLQRFYRKFNPTQIKVYLFEDFCQNPLTVMADMFEFIGVDPTFCPNMSERPNKSGFPKHPWMHQILTKPNPLKSMAKPFFPKILRQKIQHQNLKTPEMSDEIRQYLADLYQDDIQQCGQMIQRDLSFWLNAA